jgi:hypothetical protein
MSKATLRTKFWKLNSFRKKVIEITDVSEKWLLEKTSWFKVTSQITKTLCCLVRLKQILLLIPFCHETNS